MSSTRDSAYCSQMERKTFAQPVVKRARVQRDLAPQAAVDDSRPKNFQCDLCEGGFDRQSDLRRHKKIHFPGEFYCLYPGCDKSFKRKDHLINHVEKKHRDSSSSAPQMPVLGNNDPENDPDSGNYPGYPLNSLGGPTRPKLVAKFPPPPISDSGCNQVQVPPSLLAHRP